MRVNAGIRVGQLYSQRPYSKTFRIGEKSENSQQQYQSVQQHTGSMLFEQEVEQYRQYKQSGNIIPFDPDCRSRQNIDQLQRINKQYDYRYKIEPETYAFFVHWFHCRGERYF